MSRRKQLTIGKKYFLIEQGSIIEARCTSLIFKKRGRYCKTKYLFKRPDGKIVVRNPYKAFDTKEIAITRIPRP